MRKLLIFIGSVFCLFGAGCATIPNGGYSGNLSELGAPGRVLGRVEVAEGMLVETVSLGAGKSVNIQINRDKPPSKEYFLHDNVLTIGRFSKVFGSGFTKKKNIYYRKRIFDRGTDVFDVDGRKYLVNWNCIYRNPWSELSDRPGEYVVEKMMADKYIITIHGIEGTERSAPKIVK